MRNDFPVGHKIQNFNFDLKATLKEKLANGLQHKKILITSLDSPFLDSQYVFPYLGILYLVAVAANIGMRIKYINQQEFLLNERVLL
jgi:hypothetical protein